MTDTMIPLVAFDLSTMTEAEFRASRLQGMGSSDAAAALGLSDYTSPWALYHLKRGELEVDENEAMYWGKAHEATIANRWAEDHPDHELKNPQLVYRHPVHEWATASPDRYVDGDGILEVKTASTWVASKWDNDTVPDEYMIQGQWQCEVLGRDWVEFAVLIGGNDYRTHRFDRDREIGQMLLEKVGVMWQQILDGVPPEPVGSDRVADMWPFGEPDTVLHLEAELVEQVAEIKSIDTLIKQLKNDSDQLKNVLRVAMGDKETAVFDGDVVATWKNNARGARTLRLK